MSEVQKPQEAAAKNVESVSSALTREAQSLLGGSGSERTQLASGKASLPAGTEIGPSDPEKQMTVTVMVKSKATEKEIDDALNKITSGKMAPLTDAEFNARFGADEKALGRVLKFANSHGLKAVEVDPRSGRVELSGKTKDFNDAFKVSLKDYDDKDNGPFHSHNNAPSVPKGIGKDIDGVLGLDDRKIAEPHIVMPPPPEGGFQPRGLFSGYIPTQVAEAYNFPKESMGKGQSVAIIELGGGLDFKDNAQYYKAHNLKLPEINVITVNGAENKTGSGADGEVALDSQVIGAVAPDAKQNLIFAANTDQGFVDAITRATFPKDGETENSAISISWGAPESAWTDDARHAMSVAFKKAALKGISVFCASGDSGAKDNSKDGKYTTDYPSTDPWVTGTGGTRLKLDSNNQRRSEVAWNDGRLIGLGKLVAGGGGISAKEGVPDYQADAKLPPNANKTGLPGRGVPDIAGSASMLDGFQIRVGGHEAPVGGTSGVSPLYAALVMRVNSALGHNVGFINPFLYKKENAGMFFDVTQGNNGGYDAGPGWDGVTGMGVLDGQKFLNALRKADAAKQVGK